MRFRHNLLYLILCILSIFIVSIVVEHFLTLQKMPIPDEQLYQMQESVADIKYKNIVEYEIPANYVDEDDTNDISDNTQNTNQITTITHSLPSGTDGSMKCYMDYRTLTNTTSEQYALQQQAYTDEFGYRRVDDYYMVALGSAYGTEIGNKYLITLDNGLVFPAILGDCKMDVHTDSTNRYIEKNGNIVEYIVDTNKIGHLAKEMGDVSYHGFDGKIVKIEQIIETVV